MNRARRCALLAYATAWTASLGCAMPVMHPFRTHDGPGARAALVAHVGAKDAGQCDNTSGCHDNGAGGLSMLNLDGRWGHMLGKHVGVMGGAYAPGFRNSKTDSGYATFVGYGVVTAQGDVLSVGLGPEVGSHIAGAAAGLDIELIPLFDVDLPQHLLAIHGYARYLRPYTIEESHTNGRVPSWDAGGGLRVGPIVAQYTYYRQTSGVIDYVIYESSIQAQSWHMVAIALELNADSLDFESPSDRERQQLWEQRQRQIEEEQRRKAAWERLQPKPVRPSWPGCKTLCRAQADLPCGVPREACEERCKRREVPPPCRELDDAVMQCQAEGVQCQHGQLRLPPCLPARRAYARCLHGATDR